MQLFVASDHAGYSRKIELINSLDPHLFQILDFGTKDADQSVDYPDFANAACVAFLDQNPDDTTASYRKLKAALILICGSGQGMAMRANRFLEIRAALCWTSEVAQLARQHNNANALCLGSRLIDLPTSVAILKTFLDTEFEQGRHSQRVAKLSIKP